MKYVSRKLRNVIGALKTPNILLNIMNSSRTALIKNRTDHSINLKLFGKNVLTYVIGNATLRASSFLLIPLYTHSLSVNDYGLLATLLITTQVMIMFMSLGTQKGLMRFVTEYESNNLIGRLLGSSILINLAGGLIVTGISVLFLLSFFRSVLHTDHVLGYIVLTCCAAMVQSLCIHILSYYRAGNEGMKFMLASVLAALVLIIINLLFLLILHQGIKGVLMAEIITYGGLWLFVSFNMVSKTGMGVSMQLIWRLLRFSFPLIFVMLGGLITQVSAVYFLSYFRSLEQVAIYSLGLKMAMISDIALILPFQLAYEPFAYANVRTPGIRATIAKLLTYLMLAFAFVAFGIVFISRDLLRLIAPPEYFSAYLVIFLLLPGIAFKGVYYVGESLLHIKNKTYTTGTVVAVFTLLSVILNYLLIPHWGMYGAIFVFNLTSISISVLLMILGMKAFPIRLESRRLGVAGGLLVSFLSMTFFLSGTSPYVYYSILPMAACASIAYVYFGNFCDDYEKTVIRSVLYGIRSKVSP